MPGPHLQVYDEPTVLLAKRVTGEEEVPEGAVAVLTPDAPDVLSHVSVRARNMKVLFAICHEAKPLAERVRPTSLDDFVGQRHLLAPGALLRNLIDRDTLGSMLLWGALSFSRPVQLNRVTQDRLGRAKRP